MRQLVLADPDQIIGPGSDIALIVAIAEQVAKTCVAIWQAVGWGETGSQCVSLGIAQEPLPAIARVGGRKIGQKVLIILAGIGRVLEVGYELTIRHEQPVSRTLRQCIAGNWYTVDFAIPDIDCDTDRVLNLRTNDLRRCIKRIS